MHVVLCQLKICGTFWDYDGLNRYAKKMPASVLLALGRNIQEIRTRNLWSQDELSDKSGLNHSHIGAIEKGQRNVTMQTLWRLADALDRESRKKGRGPVRVVDFLDGL